MPVATGIMSCPDMRPNSRCDSPVRTGTFPLQLLRDGQCVPWGFRLVGGQDVQNSKMVIQKVCARLTQLIRKARGKVTLHYNVLLSMLY